MLFEELQQRVGGIQIVTVPDTIEKPRKWWKRMFWKPWQKTYTVENPAALRDGQSYIFEGKYFCNPRTHNVLTREIDCV